MKLRYKFIIGFYVFWIAYAIGEQIQKTELWKKIAGYEIRLEREETKDEMDTRT